MNRALRFRVVATGAAQHLGEPPNTSRSTDAPITG
jgi:hypothetical protein